MKHATLTVTILLLLIIQYSVGHPNPTTPPTVTKDLVIQEASLETLDEIMAIDQEVSYEYFIPLYRLAYPGTYMGNNPKEALTEELTTDRESFEKAIKRESDCYLITAFDTELKKHGGFIFFRKIGTDTIRIEYLLILKEFRKRGAGKKLITAAINYFDTTKHCYTDTDRNHNDATIKFYEKMGFVNQGPTPSGRILQGGMPARDVWDQWYFQVKK